MGSWSWQDELACMAGSVTYRIDLALGKEIFLWEVLCIHVLLLCITFLILSAEGNSWSGLIYLMWF